MCLCVGSPQATKREVKGYQCAVCTAASNRADQGVKMSETFDIIST